MSMRLSKIFNKQLPALRLTGLKQLTPRRSAEAALSKNYYTVAVKHCKGVLSSQGHRQ